MQPMFRFLAILILLASGMPVAGAGAAPERHSCGDVGCHAPVVRVSCCGDEVIAESVCASSGGACTCDASPVPDREPEPEAPLPLPVRDTLTHLPNAPPSIRSIVEPGRSSASPGGLVPSLTAGRSHNQVQSLLGVWRT